MQRLFHKSPGEAALRERDPRRLEACLRDGGWVWIDLLDPTEEEVRAVGSRFGFDALSIQDVLDVTLLPKVDDHGGYLFVVLHGVVTGEQQRLATEELDMFLGADFLVTAHRSPIVAVDWITNHVSANDRLATSGPAGIAAAIAEAGSRRYLPLLDALDERIEALEDHAVAADPRMLGESQALRRDVIMLRRILGPQRDVLRELGQSLSPVLTDATRRGFGDVYDHHFRLVESLDAARALLGAVLDTYRGAVAERTNEVMKVLTVFSAILLPMALIAGLWGMNFDRIPGSEWRWGFVGLLGVMALLAVALWVYFTRRGFIGGPKLRELPKAVGLGLVSIGTAPLRVVTAVTRTATTGRRESKDTAPAPDQPPAPPKRP